MKTTENEKKELERKDHEEWINGVCSFCGGIRRYCDASGVYKEVPPPPTRWPEGAEL